MALFQLLSYSFHASSSLRLHSWPPLAHLVVKQEEAAAVVAVGEEEPV